MRISSSLALLPFAVSASPDLVLSLASIHAEKYNKYLEFTHLPWTYDAPKAQLHGRAFIPIRPPIPHDIPTPEAPSDGGALDPGNVSDPDSTGPVPHIGQDPVDPEDVPAPTNTVPAHIGEDSDPVITPTPTGASQRPTATENKTESEPDIETPDIPSSTAALATSQTGAFVGVLPTANQTTLTSLMANSTQDKVMGDACGSRPSLSWVGIGAVVLFCLLGLNTS